MSKKIDHLETAKKCFSYVNMKGSRNRNRDELLAGVCHALIAIAENINNLSDQTYKAKIVEVASHRIFK